MSAGRTGRGGEGRGRGGEGRGRGVEGRGRGRLNATSCPGLSPVSGSDPDLRPAGELGSDLDHGVNNEDDEEADLGLLNRNDGDGGFEEGADVSDRTRLNTIAI